MGNVLFAAPSDDQEDSATESSSPSGTKKTLIFVEGNISSGKSTLIESLKARGYPVWTEAVDKLTGEYVDDQGRNILNLFYEDKKTYGFKLQVVSMATRWQLIKEALDYLHGIRPAPSDAIFNSTRQEPLDELEVSDDPEVIIHRVPSQKKDDSKTAEKNPRERIAFVERSILTDIFSFALNLRECEFIDGLDWKIYTDLLKGHLKDAVPHFGDVDVAFLYLRTSPEVCLARKQERGRLEETSVGLFYLKLLHSKNEKWLVEGTEAVPRIIIDGDQSREIVLEETLREVMAFHAEAHEDSGIELLNAELASARF
jgi:deoxyadenosine/deoxycytidine kinase